MSCKQGVSNELACTPFKLLDHIRYKECTTYLYIVLTDNLPFIKSHQRYDSSKTFLYVNLKMNNAMIKFWTNPVFLPLSTTIALKGHFSSLQTVTWKYHNFLLA
jgi:hypothetical protein